MYLLKHFTRYELIKDFIDFGHRVDFFGIIHVLNWVLEVLKLSTQLKTWIMNKIIIEFVLY